MEPNHPVPVLCRLGLKTKPFQYQTSFKLGTFGPLEYRTCPAFKCLCVKFGSQIVLLILQAESTWEKLATCRAIWSKNHKKKTKPLVIVLHCDSDFCRVGFAGANVRSDVFPSILGTPKNFLANVYGGKVRKRLNFCYTLNPQCTTFLWVQ